MNYRNITSKKKSPSHHRRPAQNLVYLRFNDVSATKIIPNINFAKKNDRKML